MQKTGFFGVFDQHFGPSKFHFCLGKRSKTTKQVSLRRMNPAKCSLECFQKLLYWHLNLFLNAKKKCKTIGVQAKVPLFASSIYRAVLKENLGWKNARLKKFTKYPQKISRPKLAFLKSQKSTGLSEIQQNMINAKRSLLFIFFK